MEAPKDRQPYGGEYNGTGTTHASRYAGFCDTPRYGCLFFLIA